MENEFIEGFSMVVNLGSLGALTGTATLILIPIIIITILVNIDNHYTCIRLKRLEKLEKKHPKLYKKLVEDDHKKRTQDNKEE